MSAFYDRQPLGIEAIPDPDIFSYIHRTERKRVWTVNLAVGLAVFAACAFGYYARFYM